MWFMLLDALYFAILVVTSTITESEALGALSFLSLFHTLAMFSHLIALWAVDQRPNEHFPSGLVRAETLSLFTVSILTVLGAVICLKESLEHVLHDEEHDFLDEDSTQTVNPAIFLVLLGGILLQLWFALLTKNTNTFKASARAGPSSVPCISMLSSGITDRNVHVMGGLVCYGCAAFVFLAISIDERTRVLDAFSAGFTAVWLFIIAMPVATATARVLLQTAPTEAVSGLDKCLRELTTIDGVLEYANEHFWSLGPDTIAGSLLVRIRRDASEQVVLTQCMSKLSTHVTPRHLTIQIVKDDWLQSQRRPPQTLL